MNKVFNLLKNELIKASRKPFYIVMVALTAAAVILGAGFMKLVFSAVTDSDFLIGFLDDENYDEILTDAEATLEKTRETVLKEGVTENSLYEFYAALTSIEAFDVQKEYKFEVADSEKYSYYAYASISEGLFKDGFILESAVNLVGIRAYDRLCAEVDNAYKAGAPDYRVDLKQFEPEFYLYKTDFEDILKVQNFGRYTEFKNKTVNDNTEISDIEKKIKIENNNLLNQIYDTIESDSAWYDISSKFDLLTMNKAMLATGKNQSGLNLSESETKIAKETVAEIELGLKKGACGYGGKQTSEQAEIATMAVEFGLEIAGIFIVIFGALLVAEEIQSGSIKALIIAPCSRRKIFTSKLLVLLIAVGLEAALVYLMFLFSNLIFGLGSSAMVFTIGGKAVAINYYIYHLFTVLLKMIDLFVYGIFALMLSTILRNTGGAMSISLVITQVITGITSTITMLATGDVLMMIAKFIPSSNLNISSRLFTSSVDMNNFYGFDLAASYNSGASWKFSIIYLAILSALIIWTGYQSFEKRDIK